MAKAQIILGELGGGVNADWIEPTYSNGNTELDFTWDYDADSFLFVSKLANNAYKIIVIFNRETQSGYGALEDNKWYQAVNFPQWSMVITSATTEKRHLHIKNTYTTYDVGHCYLIPLTSVFNY